MAAGPPAGFGGSGCSSVAADGASCGRVRAGVGGEAEAEAEADDDAEAHHFEDNVVVATAAAAAAAAGTCTALPLPLSPSPPTSTLPSSSSPASTPSPSSMSSSWSSPRPRPTTHHSPDETSPLLGRRSSSTSASAFSDTTNNNTDHNHDHNHDHHGGGAATSPFLTGMSPSRFWLVFLQLLSTQFIACFDASIMASSHPVITSYFGAARSASWLSTAFLLASTAVQPLLGRLSDAVGRKPLMLICLVVFAAATTACALAPSMGAFIAARAVCGLGAGGALTLGSIIVSDLVPIERRGAYQSYMNVAYGIGTASGAALGGAMAEALGWRWEFGVQVPPLLVSIVVAVLVIPPGLGIDKEGQDEDNGGRGHGRVWRALRTFDAAGSLLLTTAISFLVLGLSLGGNILPWSHPLVVAALVVFAICTPCFVVVETRATKPIMPLGLLRCAPRANLILANFLAAVISHSIFFNIPLYFQAVLLSSATDSGLRLVLPSIVASIAGTSTGFAITWTRRLKWPLVAGTTLYLIGCACLCLLRRDLPAFFYHAVQVPAALGQGFQFPGTFMAVLACSPQAEQAVVTGTLILWRSLGMVLSVAASSLVVQNALAHYLGEYVRGPEWRRAEVIAAARSSVGAVARLEQPYRGQVVASYETALRLTFACCAGAAAVAVLLIWPARLPRLAPKGKRRA